MAEHSVKEILTQDGSPILAEVARRDEEGTLITTIKATANNAQATASNALTTAQVAQGTANTNEKSIESLNGYFSMGVAKKAIADNDGNEIKSTYVKASTKGQANGVASLDSTGKVPSSQLPSYVDDVLEYDSQSGFPGTGETGKIYVAKDTNKTYRWSGSAYTEISASIALGETSSTAYAGDKGKQNASDIATLKTDVAGAKNKADDAYGMAQSNAGSISSLASRVSTVEGTASSAKTTADSAMSKANSSVQLSGDQTINGNKTFNGNVTFDGTVHSDLEFDSATGFTVGNNGYYGSYLKNGSSQTNIPSKSGTMALTTDIPVKIGSTLTINW